MRPSVKTQKLGRSAWTSWNTRGRSVEKDLLAGNAGTARRALGHASSKSRLVKLMWYCAGAHGRRRFGAAWAQRGGEPGGVAGDAGRQRGGPQNLPAPEDGHGRAQQGAARPGRLPLQRHAAPPHGHPVQGAPAPALPCLRVSMSIGPPIGTAGTCWHACTSCALLRRLPRLQLRSPLATGLEFLGHNTHTLIKHKP